MIAALVFAVLTQSAPLAPEVQLTVKLADHDGHDVTSLAEASDKPIATKLVVWTNDQDGREVDAQLGKPISIRSLSDRDLFVGLEEELSNGDLAPLHPSALAGGWGFSGEVRPWIVLEPGSSGPHRLPIGVARTHSIELTLALPDAVSPTEELRAGGALVIESGIPRGFQFVDYGPVAKVVKTRQMDLVPGHYSIWGAASWQIANYPPTTLNDERYWAHEELQISDRDGQRIVVHYRRGVEITGRFVNSKGEPAGEHQGPWLMPTALMRVHGFPGGRGMSYSTLWTPEGDFYSRFKMTGMPPGAELVTTSSRDTKIIVPEHGGDVGSIIID